MTTHTQKKSRSPSLQQRLIGQTTKSLGAALLVLALCLVPGAALIERRLAEQRGHDIAIAVAKGFRGDLISNNIWIFREQSAILFGSESQLRFDFFLDTREGAARLVKDTPCQPSSDSGACWAGVFGPLVVQTPVFFDNTTSLAGRMVLVDPSPMSARSSLPLFGFAFFVFFGAAVATIRSMRGAIRTLRDSLSDWSKTLSSPTFANKHVRDASSFVELEEVHTLVNSMNVRVAGLIGEEAKRAHERAALAIAKQVEHDLRSPIASLSIFSRDCSTIEERDRERLQHITTRIESIAADLKGVFGPPAEVGKPHKSLERVVTDLVEEKESLLAAKGKSFPILMTVDSEVSRCHVPGTRLSRALSNLLDNAIESLEDDNRHPSIHVKVARDPVSDNLLVQVSDNGSGISPAVSAALGSLGVSKKSGLGHGLGLSSAKEFAEALGGSLEIVSPSGLFKRGTDVTLRLQEARLNEA